MCIAIVSLVYACYWRTSVAVDVGLACRGSPVALKPLPSLTAHDTFPPLLWPLKHFELGLGVLPLACRQTEYYVTQHLNKGGLA
jgi:hypothetical protein